jgi:hypothetical protein
MSSLGLQAAYTAGKLLHDRAAPPQCLREKLHRTWLYSAAQSHLFYPSGGGTERFFAAKDASRSVFTHFASSFR